MSASRSLSPPSGDLDRPSTRSLAGAGRTPSDRRLGILGPARSPGRSVAGRIVATIALWRRRACERRLLATFGERERHDLGLSPGDVMTEAAKPFWCR